MRLKYYLKGFGIGVLFATGVLSIFFYTKTENEKNASLSQQEIESLAEQLGMSYPTEDTIEETESSEKNQESVTMYETQTQRETVTTTSLETTKVKETTAPLETTKVKETTAPLETTTKARETTAPLETTTKARETTTPLETTTKVKETIAPLETAIPEAVSSEYAEGETETLEWKRVVVKSGMGSKTVARLLEEAGIIEDADSFNRYMVSSGYSTRIRTGTYEFLPGTSYEAIVTEFTRIPKTN